jgi:hypothetical protein
VSEPTCPFCGAPLGEAFRTFAAPRAPTARLSRAALFAVGASGAIVGCGETGGIQPFDGASQVGFVVDAALDVAPADAAPKAESAVDATVGDVDASGVADAAEEGPCNMVCALYGVNPDTGQDDCWCQ